MQNERAPDVADAADAEPHFSRGRKSRGRGLRKTTGCLTCRRRHVSCDERKPVCGGCTKTKQTCTYRLPSGIESSKDAPGRRRGSAMADRLRSATGLPVVTEAVALATATDTDRERGAQGDDSQERADASRPPQVPRVDGQADDSEPPSGPVHGFSALLAASRHATTPPTCTDASADPSTRTTTVTSTPTTAVSLPAAMAPLTSPPTRGASSVAVTAAGPAPAASSAIPAPPAPAPPAPAPPAQAPMGTPSTSQSLHSLHSPGQTRQYAPSVSSGHLSVSHDLFGSGSIFSMVPNVDAATAQWLGLLIGDATQETDGLLPAMEWDDAGEQDASGPPGQLAQPGQPGQPGQLGQPGQPMQPTGLASCISSNPTLQERFVRDAVDQQLFEMQAWQSAIPVVLMPHEHYLFHHFITNISSTMDLFDPKKSFGTFVPHLAEMHNVGLINAILALAVRHLSLQAKETGTSPDRGQLSDAHEAVQYYYKTLHYIQKAMEYDTYKTSLELLATSIIVSTYEMLDGTRRDWERHLKGVFWIQRSQVIHGDSGGLRQAVWWSWLCQDVWAAFRERRKPRTFWQPKRKLDELDPYELAARSVLLFAHVVAFCSAEETEEQRASPAARIAKADALLASLEDWRRHQTVEFEPLPTPPLPHHVFQPLWIHPPAFGVALQIYYCSLILLTLNRPHVGDIDAYLQQRKLIQRYVAVVCGIALTMTEDASSIMCSQCLYIAGLSIEDPKRQAAVLGLLEQCRQRAVWPAIPLGDELARKWQEAC